MDLSTFILYFFCLCGTLFISVEFGQKRGGGHPRMCLWTQKVEPEDNASPPNHCCSLRLGSQRSSPSDENFVYVFFVYVFFRSPDKQPKKSEQLQKPAGSRRFPACTTKRTPLGNGRNTVSRVLFRRRELTEFQGKLGEFCEKLGEFALAHK